MVFEETLKKLNLNVLEPTETKNLTFELETKREYNLLRLKEAYSKEIKPISKTKLIKIAIDNLINDVEKLPEEEGIEYIRTLLKESELY